MVVPSDKIVAAMQAFRIGARPAMVMDCIVKGFTDEVIPPRVRADPFAARRSQALRASPQRVRAKARWYYPHHRGLDRPASMMPASSRRSFLGGALAASVTLVPGAARTQARARVVVIGGGFAGATCARDLKRSGLAVTLVEPNPIYTSCPFSNEVIA